MAERGAVRTSLAGLLACWPCLAHLAVVAWLFAGAIFAGQVFYFRDIVYYYYPNYVFLERSLSQGVWPLWNPTSDAGAPFLMADPIDLALVGLLGAENALRLGPPLHIALAMCGASWLATVLFSATRLSAWAAGLFYGLSGYVLSTVNMFELFHATAWGPWVVAAVLRVADRPSPRRIAAAAVLAATQVATLGAETVLQTALLCLALVLARSRPSFAAIRSLVAAAALAALLAAPVLAGVRALVGDSARAAGLAPDQSFAYSLRPIALADALLPRFFGDVHTFSDVGFWGQPFFPDGFPYLLSLYLGPGILWLAVRSPRGRLSTTLAALAVVGVLLALGRHGPLEWALAPLMRHFRSPPKFLFLANLALCLLAARGLAEAAARRSRWDWAFGALGFALAALYPVLSAWPELPARILGGVLPEIRDPRAAHVVASAWPLGFGTAGAMLVGAVLAARSSRTVQLAGLLVGLDLLLTNGSVNRTADRAFYTLRQPLRGAVEAARGEGSFRFFAYGASAVPDLRFAPELTRLNKDVWLYYVERQSLAPRTQLIDGLDGAFDEDRVGWAPRGASLDPRERVPSRYPEHHARLRLANVRFVASFRVLTDEQLSLRGEVALPEVLEPLRVYELRDALPRAFRVQRYEVFADPAAYAARLADPAFDPRTTVLLTDAPDAAAAAPSSSTSNFVPALPVAEDDVRYERLDPHTVRLRAAGPAGLLVVSEGHHADFRAEAGGEPRVLQRANGRYWAIPTRGGGETITVRYAPAWRPWALGACALGGLGVAFLVVAGRRARV